MKVKEGDMVSIPFDDYCVVGKILYVSEYFKNIALFKFIPARLSRNEDYLTLFESSSI